MPPLRICLVLCREFLAQHECLLPREMMDIKEHDSARMQIHKLQDTVRTHTHTKNSEKILQTST